MPVLHLPGRGKSFEVCIHPPKESCQKCGNFHKKEISMITKSPASHRHTCYLYSGCEVFTTDCEDCTTGKLECDICIFENMLPDGSCGMDFTHFGCAKKHNLGLSFKGIVHNFFLYRSNLIFWIVMGCGIADFGRRGL